MNTGAKCWDMYIYYKLIFTPPSVKRERARRVMRIKDDRVLQIKGEVFKKKKGICILVDRGAVTLCSKYKRNLTFKSNRK